MKTLGLCSLCLLLLGGCQELPLLGGEKQTLSYAETFYRYLDKIPQDTLQAFSGQDHDRLATFGTAYTLANRSDFQEIDGLKRSADPARWLEIYRLYHEIAIRDSLVAALPAKIKAAIPSHDITYEKDLKYARFRAAAYLYASGRYYLEKSAMPASDPETGLTETDRENFRSAYSYFSLTEQYLPGFRDADSLIRYCLGIMAPTAMIEFAATQELLQTTLEWQYALIYFPGFELEPEIDGMPLAPISFHTPLSLEESDPGAFDFIVRIAIDTITISPLQNYQTRNTVRKSIWDASSSDSITAECFVQTYEQKQTCRIHAIVEIENTATGTIMISAPIPSIYTYHSSFGHTVGDTRALTTAQLKNLNSPDTAEDPTPEFILKMTALEFHADLRDFLQRFFDTQLF